MRQLSKKRSVTQTKIYGYESGGGGQKYEWMPAYAAAPEYSDPNDRWSFRVCIHADYQDCDTPGAIKDMVLED